MGVDSLGYVAFNVSALDNWNEVLVKVFGMEPRTRAESATVDYRLDEYHHRITLYPNAQDSVAVVGWEVGSLDKLEALVSELSARGVTLTEGSVALRAERKVKQVYQFTCPMIGCPTEIYYGPLASNTPFAPSRGVAGYKTGSLGLGHVVFWVKDLKATVDFYRHVMGFEISDYIAWDDNDAVFMHCNPRHHTLALPIHGLQAIDNEVLLIHGREDRVVPPDASLTMHKLLKNSQLHMIGRCGHWTMMEHPNRFRQLVENFLDEENA